MNIFSLISLEIKLNLALRTFSVRAILVLKINKVLILTVIYYINHQLVIGDLVLKVKQVLILTVLKARFDRKSNYILLYLHKGDDIVVIVML